MHSRPWFARLLAAVALVATGIPAMRASRINPVVVLQK